MNTALPILVPTDFSRHSQQAVDRALRLRELFPARFLLLHVVMSGELDVFASLAAEPAETLNRRKAEAEKLMATELQRCRNQFPGVAITGRVVDGVPFKEICRQADQEACKLIVIGTHGRTGLSHLLIGSTAERVVQHAACAVLSIKPATL
ncbi:MAG: universal stress protein [Trichloromonadaceae bacterium]